MYHAEIQPLLFKFFFKTIESLETSLHAHDNRARHPKIPQQTFHHFTKMRQ